MSIRDRLDNKIQQRVVDLDKLMRRTVWHNDHIPFFEMIYLAAVE